MYILIIHYNIIKNPQYFQQLFQINQRVFPLSETYRKKYRRSRKKSQYKFRFFQHANKAK